MGCAESKDWLPDAVDVYVKKSSKGKPDDIDSMVVALTMSQRAHVVYGAPATVWVTLDFGDSTTARIDATVQWMGKTPTRLPEASLFSLGVSPCNALQTDVRDGGSQPYRTLSTCTSMNRRM
eukprot:m.931275 g.931275  ORF g.931275 m.931275 type:complete len:122 (-) comp23783_c0_seq28:2360-2725(-)